MLQNSPLLPFLFFYIIFIHLIILYFYSIFFYKINNFFLYDITNISILHNIKIHILVFLQIYGLHLLYPTYSLYIRLHKPRLVSVFLQSMNNLLFMIRPKSFHCNPKFHCRTAVCCNKLIMI